MSLPNALLDVEDVEVPGTAAMDILALELEYIYIFITVHGTKVIGINSGCASCAFLATRNRRETIPLLHRVPRR